jgi:hypothetical protein
MNGIPVEVGNIVNTIDREWNADGFGSVPGSVIRIIALLGERPGESIRNG